MLHNLFGIEKMVLNQRLLVGLGVTVILLVIALIIAVVGIAILASNQSSPSETQNIAPDQCSGPVLDVAIVGAGITGSYTAWRMRNKFEKISLFESTNRIGGRLYTHTMPNGMKAEFGGMRFKDTHKHINKLVDELGLTKVPVVEDPGFQDLYYMRRTRKYSNETVKTSDFPMYNVYPNEQNKTYQEIFSHVWSQAVDFASQSSTDPVDYVTRDGQLVRDLGGWNLHSQYGSEESHRYLRDTLGIDVFFTNEVNSVNAFFPDSRGQSSFSTVKEGFQEVAVKLIQQFLEARETNSVQYNYKLVSVRKSSSSYLKLTFSKTITEGFLTKENSLKEEIVVCSKRLILAVPPPSLAHIDWPPLFEDKTVKSDLGSFGGAQANRIYLTFDQPWWRHLPTPTKHMVTDLPLRRIRETFVREDNSSLLLAAYPTGDPVDYWYGLLQGTKSDVNSASRYNVTESMVSHLLNHIAETLGISVSDIPSPTGAAAHFWNSEEEGYAWYILKPGYNWRTVQERMSKPRADYEVYVVSTYGPPTTSEWANAGVQLVDYALKRHFNIEFYTV